MKYAFLLIGTLALTCFAFQSNEKRSIAADVHLKAPSSGIKFDKLSLEKAKKEAKSSGKKIFIDVYTTWCGPCKEMSKTTFQNDEVGDLFNKKFVNLKIDAENDADGAFVSKNFKVNAYPTLLFLDSEGNLLKKLVGKQSQEKLISVAESI